MVILPQDHNRLTSWLPPFCYKCHHQTDNDPQLRFCNTAVCRHTGLENSFQLRVVTLYLNERHKTKTLKSILQTHDNINWTEMFVTMHGGGFCGDDGTNGKAQSSVSRILTHCLILLARN